MPLIPLGEPAGRDRWLLEHEGRQFAVFLVGRHYRVVDAACPHNGGPLIEGTFRADHTLVCPWHWFRYDLDTGECKNLDRYRLGTYPVVERDGRLLAELPEPEPARTWSQILREHAEGGR